MNEVISPALSGSVASLHLHPPAPGAPLHQVDSIEVIAGKGILGEPPNERNREWALDLRGKETKAWNQTAWQVCVPNSARSRRCGETADNLMKRHRCERERETLEAAQCGRLTGSYAEDLRSHMADCPVCADLLFVFEALQARK